MTPGYKQTEVGVIPEEWEVKLLRHVLRKGRLGGNYPNQLGATSKPLMKMGNLARGHMDVAKIEYIPDGVAADPQHRLCFGDVLFNTRNTLDLVGKVAIWRDELPLAYYNSNLMRLEFDPAQVCSSEYANAALNARGAVGLLRGLATGTTSVAAIYTRDLLELPFITPPLPEQRSIAAALSEVDAFLASLDRLIAKKRDLKQAAMQQLLTGQTRLPGFAGEWVEQRLGESATLKARIGWQGLTTAEYLESGDYYLITGTEFLDGSIDWNSCHFVDENRYRQDRYIQIRPRDVLVTKDGTIGKVALVRYLDLPATLNSGVFVIRPKEKAFEPEFFYYVLCSEIFGDFLAQLSAGSTISHLYQKDFVSFRYRLPPTHAEQTAIAAVLSDMDAELAALEQRREKTRALKQGMMQELLTGRTRLVVPASVELQAADVVSVDSSQVAQAKPTASERPHNWAINEAVVVAVLAKNFGSEKFPLGRKRCTKLSYLLHRHVERVAQGYLKKAAGPYNPSVKYSGPESIAQKNGYIRPHKNGSFSGFVAADKIAQAEGYFEKWYGQEVLAWLELFRFKSNDELELLATVDMAAEDLRREEKDVNLPNLRSVIASHREWEAKLNREIFSDSNIERATRETAALFR